jgi:hypothetical protein
MSATLVAAVSNPVPAVPSTAVAAGHTGMGASLTSDG